MSPVGTSVEPSTDKRVRRDTARRDRYLALDVVRRETRLKAKDGGVPRLALCRRAVNDTAGGVSVMVTNGPDGITAGISGLQTCGSVWACPVCSEKINAGRQYELEAGIAGWIASGKSVLFLTATMRHNAGHRLADLWDAISPAWNRMTSGAGVAWNGGKTDLGDKARFGIRGYVRLVETKHGVHGWHPHVHSLLFLDAPLTDAQVSDLRSRMFGRWEAALAKRGFSVLEGVGLDLRPVTSGSGLADYFAKNTYGVTPAGAAYEVTGSHSKRLGKGGATPFQLLERFVNDGTADDLDRWHEWEKASHGRRQLTWSRGMRDLLALEAELSDQELAEAELDGECAVAITRDEWIEHRLWTVVPYMLEAAEGGYLGRFLDFIPPRRFFESSGSPGSR